MGGVDGDGGQQRIDFALEVVLGKGAGVVVELLPLEQADALLAQLGEQLVVPAAVLGVDKAVDFGGEDGEGFVGAQAVVARLAVAVFNALHEAGLADFDVLVEVGAGDGEELDALEQGIGGVFGFFKHTPVELHPGVVAAVEELLFWSRSGHRACPVRRVGSLQRFGGGWHLRGAVFSQSPNKRIDTGGRMKGVLIAGRKVAKGGALRQVRGRAAGGRERIGLESPPNG